MHVVVSWDIKASGKRWTQIDTMMKEALQPYSCVQPLSTFYIVQINETNDQRSYISVFESPDRIIPGKSSICYDPSNVLWTL